MESLLPIIRAALGLVAGGGVLALVLSHRHRDTPVHDRPRAVNQAYGALADRRRSVAAQLT